MPTNNHADKHKLMHLTLKFNNYAADIWVLYYYKATKELKLASGIDTIKRKVENYNIQHLRMRTEEFMHNQRITYNRVS